MWLWPQPNPKPTAPAGPWEQAPEQRALAVSAQAELRGPEQSLLDTAVLAQSTLLFSFLPTAEDWGISIFKDRPVFREGLPGG